MNDDDLSTYGTLADRWVSKSAPFNGIAYSRAYVKSASSVDTVVMTVLQALAANGFCDEIVVGDDHFNDGDSFYPEAIICLEEVQAKLQSPNVRYVLSGEEYDCSYCLLAGDFEWLLRLEGYEPHEEMPDGGVEITLFISREGMRKHDLDSIEHALRQEDASWTPETPGEYPV
jgi:hypothetical protein